METDFETIHSWDSATIFGCVGRHLSYIKDDTEDNDQPRLEEVFTMFRYTVMGCVFKTLKLLRKLTEKTAFANRMKSLESYIKAEDIQNWKDLAEQIPPCDGNQEDIQYVADEWRMVKELLVKVIPTLCTKDQAEDKASSELAKFRNIWEDVLNPYSTRGEIPLITTEKGLPINNRKARWAERARRNYT